MNRPSVSVCMATYNGEKYVARQLESILAELGPQDEVIVVDDKSRDGTVAVVNSLGDPRIWCVVNDVNRREVFSFGRAMSLAKNDVVFLSDQDDLWIPGRVALMTSALKASGAALVTTNFEWMNSAEEYVEIQFDGVRAADSRRYRKNIADIFIGRTNYFGCAMAYRRELGSILLPMPGFVESHDLWIALAANFIGSNVHVDGKSLRKRRHADNATSTNSTRSLRHKLWSRVIFGYSLLVIAARRFRRDDDARPAAVRAAATPPPIDT